MIIAFRPCYIVSYLWLCVYTCKAFNTWTGREPRNCFRKPQRFGASPRPIDDLQGSYDVVVVGSGVGGLSAAAMLSLYGYSVCVLESHSAPGGCAHGFSVKDKDLNGTFFFDTGPSFFSGLNPDLPAKASNPLRSVLDAIGERVECHPYTSFGLKFPEGDFVHTPDFANDVLSQASSSGPAAALQWKQLMSDMAPLERVVAALPTTAFRFDLGGLLTVSRFLPKFIAATPNPLENLKLTKPFQSIIDGAGVTDRFTRNWLDLLCFCLSGLPAKGTITAEMALMLGEFYQPNAVMDCPKHGAKAIVDALVRGIEKHGGSIFCNSHVREILIDRGKVTGVQLRNGKSVAARKAVISNLSVWDLFGANGLVDSKHFRPSFVQSRVATPVGKSFVHLHVGFRATRSELQDLQAHYMYIDDWERGVEAANNAVLVSIPSVHDPTLAPDGYAVLHIYTPATEDFAAWEGIARGSPEYTALKEDRSLYLWNVLEKIIPDIRLRAKVSKVGTPLTHKRFLRRHMGSYGPAIQAGQGDFPFPVTPIKGLLVCGDSCFPGIGIPAVAGSGILAANAVSFDSLGRQLQLLDRLHAK